MKFFAVRRNKTKPLPSSNDGRAFYNEREISCLFLHSGSLVHLLCQASLFAVSGILMHHALSRSLVDRANGGGQLGLRVLRISSNGGVKLLDGSAHPALHNAVPQILRLADLHTFLGGLDVRQRISPPLRNPAKIRRRL